MSYPDFKEFATPEILAETLADDVAKDLINAVNTHGTASLVVSGGNTPKPFFAALRRKDVPWSNIYITLADERWVDVSSEFSNEKLIRENLLTGGAKFVGLKNAEATPQDGEKLTEQALNIIPLPFDVVVLGMGGDGHTASLFPGAKKLKKALNLKKKKLCMGIEPTNASHMRMTLTLTALLSSHKIILHITGNNKREVYEQALQEGNPEKLPISAILQQNQPPIEVYWSA